MEPLFKGLQGIRVGQRGRQRGGVHFGRQGFHAARQVYAGIAAPQPREIRAEISGDGSGVQSRQPQTHRTQRRDPGHSRGNFRERYFRGGGGDREKSVLYVRSHAPRLSVRPRAKDGLQQDRARAPFRRRDRNAPDEYFIRRAGAGHAAQN